MNGAGKQRTAHVKERRGKANCANKAPAAANAWAAGRFLDIYERKVRARPRHHRPVPSQYGTWWGHGSEVRGKGVWFGGGERGKDLFCGSYPSHFWEVRSARMIDHPKEARLRREPLGACLEGKREKAFTPWQIRVLRWTNEWNKPAFV